MVRNPMKKPAIPLLRGVQTLTLLALAAVAPLRAVALESVDLMVRGDYVVTQNADNAIVRDGAVAIRDGSIVAVGSYTDLAGRYQAGETLDGTHKVLMPGLINGHTHSSMTLFRGLADDMDLLTWLQTYVFPMEGRFVDADFVRLGSELACWEYIRGGTTTVVDMYFYPEVISDVDEKCGIRAIVAAPMIDVPSPGFKGWDDSFAAGVAYVKAWQGKSERIYPGLGPHAAYTVSPEHLKQALDAATALNAPISMHLTEAPAEVEIVKERYNTTSVRLIQKLGFLDHWVIGAHVVWPDAEEIAMLAKGKLGAIHNPTSNMKGAAGFAPVPAMIQAGVNVGLGTDGAAGNNDLDLWDEIKLAALLHKGHLGDTTAIPAPVALDMATRMGARAVGLGDQIGRLEPGLKADMIQVSLDSPRLHPLYNVISHLVYAAKSEDVTTTIVSGHILMRDRKILTIDEPSLVKAVDAKAAEIRAALAEKGL